MRYYVSGDIELSKEIPEEVIQDEKGYSCGDIFFDEDQNKYTYELDFNEYFVDELECFSSVRLTVFCFY